MYRVGIPSTEMLINGVRRVRQTYATKSSYVSLSFMKMNGTRRDALHLTPKLALARGLRRAQAS